LPSLYAGIFTLLQPPLRCSRKDANRTPPECVVPGLPQAGGERFFRRPKPALHLAEGLARVVCSAEGRSARRMRSGL
jgi:hypothetical protein